MSGYTVTGEASSSPVLRGSTFVPNALNPIDSSAGYVPSYTEATATLGKAPWETSHAKNAVPSTQYRVADHRYFRLLIEKAGEYAVRLKNAAGENGDPMERATAGHELLGLLEELWTLRDLRDREWQKLVATMQSALFQAVFEQFTTEQCECVCSLVLNFLPDSALTQNRLSSALRQIREARIDVWRALSEPGERNE